MIYTENICPKCMKYQDNLTFPCPNCGFQGIDEITRIPWEDFTILEGRYLVGTAIAKEKDIIQYIALDFVENKTVKIQYTETAFKVLDSLPESDPQSYESLQKEMPRQKKTFNIRIFLAIALVIILFILILSIPQLSDFSPQIGRTSDNKTALQTRLEELGTPMDDGSIWLPVKRIDYEYQVLPMPDGTYELDTWEGPYEKMVWSYDFSKNGTVKITEYGVPGSDDTFISTYNKKGHLIETETFLGGQPFSAANYSYGKNNRIQSSHVTNVINFETGEIESGTLHYEYQNISDGGYEVIVRSEDDDSFYQINRYDKNENPVYYASIQVLNGKESIVNEIFYEYDDAGNITRCSCSDNFDTSPSFSDNRYSHIYNADGSIAKKISTDEDGNVTITEYTYDVHSNLLTEYTYADMWLRDQSTTNTFNFYIYEKFQLKNGIYVSTSGQTDASIPELPELQVPR